MYDHDNLKADGLYFICICSFSYLLQLKIVIVQKCQDLTLYLRVLTFKDTQPFNII